MSDPDDLVAARFRPDAPSGTPSTYVFDARDRAAWAWFESVNYTQMEMAVTVAAGP